MLYFFIIILTFIVAATLSVIIELKKKDLSFWVFMCGFISGITFILSLNNDAPTSMDVYQGKTTLEYTVKDGVVVDSVVVFKNKEK